MSLTGVPSDPAPIWRIGHGVIAPGTASEAATEIFSLIAKSSEGRTLGTRTNRYVSLSRIGRNLPKLANVRLLPFYVRYAPQSYRYISVSRQASYDPGCVKTSSMLRFLSESDAGSDEAFH